MKKKLTKQEKEYNKLMKQTEKAINTFIRPQEHLISRFAQILIIADPKCKVISAMISQVEEMKREVKKMKALDRKNGWR